MIVEQDLLEAADAYVAERRRLGFKDRESGSRIFSFARFAVAKGHTGPMTADLCLEWARQGALYDKPFTWASRLKDLRPFARHLALSEPKTEFPEGMPFGTTRRRRSPHIYTEDEIKAILAQASLLPPAGGLRPANIRTVIGLVAATGIRISEALSLRLCDFHPNRAVLTIRGAKSRRERLLPLHPTVCRELAEYLAVRSHHTNFEPTAPLFVSTWRFGALPYGTVQGEFRALVAKVGIVPRGRYQHPRIHDLRHTFICRRLIAWQREGVPTDNAMLALSTYVGHASVADTYWYIEGIPDLMSIAGARFEAGANRGGAHHG